MDSKTVIDRLGGPSEVARICGITPQAVSQWYGVSFGKERQIPKPWLLYLKATRPEVFAEDTKRRKARA